MQLTQQTYKNILFFMILKSQYYRYVQTYTRKYGYALQSRNNNKKKSIMNRNFMILHLMHKAVFPVLALYFFFSMEH